MQTEPQKGVNGWVVVGSEDLDALEADPSRFVATKGPNQITVRHTTFAPGIKVTDDKTMTAVMDWRLQLNGWDVARARDAAGIVKKALRLMEQR